jgi:uncharacterized membrane protein (UPF0127 family)
MTPLASFIAAAALAFAGGAHAQLPEIGLTIDGHKITVEVARTDPDRTQGLMHRRMLPESRGMLFVFRRVELHAMWMMNTYIPLSVAFLDEKGVIINIEDMEPHTRDTHPAAKPAKFALEVNPGARVEGIERAPPAQ